MKILWMQARNWCPIRDTCEKSSVPEEDRRLDNPDQRIQEEPGGVSLEM